MQINTQKTAGEPAQQFFMSPEKFQEEMECIRGMYERLAVAKERFNYLKAVGSVQHIEKLRKLYS